MSICNFCSYRRIVANANKKGSVVTVLRDAEWGMGGVNVYVHPREVEIKALSCGEDGERSKYRVSWFMELQDHCAC